MPHLKKKEKKTVVSDPPRHNTHYKHAIVQMPHLKKKKKKEKNLKLI
jgi:hypothetical protein